MSQFDIDAPVAPRIQRERNPAQYVWVLGGDLGAGGVTEQMLQDQTDAIVAAINSQAPDLAAIIALLTEQRDILQALKIDTTDIIALLTDQRDLLTAIEGDTTAAVAALDSLIALVTAGNATASTIASALADDILPALQSINADTTAIESTLIDQVALLTDIEANTATAVTSLGTLITLTEAGNVNTAAISNTLTNNILPAIEALGPKLDAINVDTTAMVSSLATVVLTLSTISGTLASILAERDVHQVPYATSEICVADGGVKTAWLVRSSRQWDAEALAFVGAELVEYSQDGAAWSATTPTGTITAGACRYDPASVTTAHISAYTVPSGYVSMAVTFIESGTINGAPVPAGLTRNDEPLPNGGIYNAAVPLTGTNFIVTEVR